MCSLEEANEAYRYIGLPGYNPHLKSNVFFKYHNKKEAEHNEILAKIEESKMMNIKQDYLGNSSIPSNHSITAGDQKSLSDKDKILLINSRRVFHIAEKGRNYVEREELARNYFDQVTAVEDSLSKNPDSYKDNSIFFQIYILNKNSKTPNLYGFRPVKRNSYLFYRLLKNGFLCGKFTDLKKNIEWTYFPIGLPVQKEDVMYICGSSYFKKNKRQRLAEAQIKMLENGDDKYKTDYNWCYWPDLD